MLSNLRKVAVLKLKFKLREVFMIRKKIRSKMKKVYTFRLRLKTQV